MSPATSTTTYHGNNDEGSSRVYEVCPHPFFFVLLTFSCRYRGLVAHHRPFLKTEGSCCPPPDTTTTSLAQTRDRGALLPTTTTPLSLERETERRCCPPLPSIHTTTSSLARM